VDCTISCSAAPAHARSCWSMNGVVHPALARTRSEEVGEREPASARHLGVDGKPLTRRHPPVRRVCGQATGVPEVRESSGSGLRARLRWLPTRSLRRGGCPWACRCARIWKLLAPVSGCAHTSSVVGGCRAYLGCGRVRSRSTRCGPLRLGAIEQLFPSGAEIPAFDRQPSGCESSPGRWCRSSSPASSVKRWRHHAAMSSTSLS